ncbi:MAG: hemerythrin domain-containing protein [Micropruina sp.]|uniref:hemerythrin domain-containing protein n=1 Tax=Micropruina sp. TaxID=2737536 RepID=UPI0039E309CD
MTDLREQALADQLRWVHDMLRRDLATVRELAQRVTEGAAATEVTAELDALRSRGPLFQLRVNCLSYCQTLGAHHSNEDTTLFPAVRLSAPHLASAVDRLEQDHAVVAALLDRIGGLADALARQQARLELVRTLEELAGHLLEHLDYEERTLEPVFASWSGSGGQMPDAIRDELARRASDASGGEQ